MRRVVLGALAFSLFAPAPMFALPLAGLLLLSGGRGRAAMVTAALSGGLSLAWLMQTGALPDQLVRSAVVVSALAFIALTWRTRLSFTHRALVATGSAALVVVLLFLLLGWTWDELAWWVQSRTGYATRLALSRVRIPTDGGAGGLFSQQFDDWMDRSIQLATLCFPGVLALQLLAGLALATALAHRLSANPARGGLGRFSEFRFTEHLGWAVAVPLLILLIPRLAAAKVVAANVLLVTGMLYAVRGLAVAAFGALATGNTTVAGVLLVGGSLFLLPVVAGAAVLLGILDAGLDLRRRWTRPPVRG